MIKLIIQQVYNVILTSLHVSINAEFTHGSFLRQRKCIGSYNNHYRHSTLEYTIRLCS